MMIKAYFRNAGVNVRKALSIILIMILSLLCGCGRAGLASSESGDLFASDPVSLAIGYTVSESDSIHSMLQDLADLLYSRSRGQISLDLYGNSELGDESEMAEQVMAGNLDAMILSADTALKYCPKISVLRLPFLFGSYAEADAVLESSVGEEIVADLGDYQMVPLCYAEGTLWQISNALRPVASPEDLTGMMLRTTGDELTLTVYEHFGALPAPMDPEELSSAIQNRVFNGQVGSLTAFRNYELSPLQPYLSLVNIQYDTSVLVMSSKVWEDLPGLYQDVIRSCAAEAAGVHRDYIRSSEDVILHNLGSSVEVITPELKPFRSLSKAVYEEYENQNEWAEDLIARIEKERKTASEP